MKTKKAKADELIPLTFKWEITYGVKKPKAKAKKGRNPRLRGK